MLKFIKKATSALLASIMCIPAGIVNITSAAQSNPDGSYTVTLADTENGLIQFSEESMNNSSASQDGYQMVHINDDGQAEQVENDGSIWAFKEGDTVEIECIPDDGYYVESLTLKDSESGKILSQKDTVDNVFSFSMPSGNNISIETVFSSTATISIRSDEKVKSSDGTEYHDIVEDMSITESEARSVVADIITEGYIKSNLNEKYATVGDEINLANILIVKNSIFDGTYTKEDDTIDNVMGSIEAQDEHYDDSLKKFISQVSAFVPVYDLDESNDYYVAYANTMIKDDSYTVQDHAVAKNNYFGQSVEGCIYDGETGLLYIPKDLYKDEEGKDIIMHLQIQFMQVFNKTNRNNDESMTSELHTISVDEKEEEIELSSYNQEIFSLETDITVDKGMDANNLNVQVNGIPVPEGQYQYNPETGDMTIAISPASVNSVEVTEGEGTLSDELLDFMEESNADPFSEMNLYQSIEVEGPQNIPEVGDIIKGKTDMNYDNAGSAGWITGPSVYNGKIDFSGNVDAWVRTILGIDGVRDPGGSSESDIYFNFTMSNWEALTPEETELYKPLFSQINSFNAVCGHITSSVVNDIKTLLGDEGWSGAGAHTFVAIRVLDKQEQNLNDGWITGHIVLGFISAIAGAGGGFNGQVGNAAIKIEYKYRGTNTYDPLYLYMFKKSTEGMPAIKDATLAGAEYEMLFFYKQDFNSAEEAVKKGSQTARFVFGTKVTHNGPGSAEYKRIANLNGIKASAGIDFFPKVSADGSEFIMDETDPKNPKIQNDFLVEGHDEYAAWFGAEGTYVIREIKAPYGYSIAGEMKGFKADANTSKPAEGVALSIGVTEGTDGKKQHTYKLDGEIITNKVINVAQEPGLALISHEHPWNFGLSSNATCLDTMSQYAGSAHRTINLKDTITIDTSEYVDAKYFVTTKLYDKKDRRFLSVDWKHQSDYSEADKNDEEEFKTTFSTGKKGHVNAGTTVRFDVGASVNVSGLEGHTLVFVNYLLVKKGADGSGSAIWPTGYMSGLGDASSFDDELEQIYIYGPPATSIINTQTSRKAGTGESIAYAGMYTDSTCTKGHGTIMQTFTDTISYNNLEEGKDYKIKAWLMDVTNGTPAPATDAQGRKIEAEKTDATAVQGNGTWEIKFDFDTTGCEGRKYVSYVEVYDNDHLVLEHKKADDKQESFMIPKITTKLRCTDSTSSTAPLAETMNFEDTITYQNLIPNANYKVETVVMDLETGRELVDAKGNKALIKSGQTFTPAAGNGTHKVNFSIAGVKTDSNKIVTSSLAGKTIVVCQYIYIEKTGNGTGNWVLVAEHADMDDKDQSMPISTSGPLYLYLYKRNAGGNTYENADLSNAGFEIAFYKGQKFNSAMDATRKGSLTATFTFKTALANDSALGSVPYRDAALRDGIKARFGIDCYPKVDEAGNFIYENDGNGNQLFQNDFLTSDRAAYTKYFGQAGTYVVREVEAPVGFSLSGEMAGYGSGKTTTKISEGLALHVAEKVNSEGHIIHQYSINGEVINEPIINTGNDWAPKEEKGAAIIIDDNPEYPEIHTNAICLDTNQQYANSESRTVSIQDKITVKTLPKVDAKYFITTKLYDLNTKRFIDVHWKNKSKYSEADKTGDAFKSEFTTNQGSINAGDTVIFDVAGIVDGTALKGHKVVFINYLLVREGTSNTGKIIWPKNCTDNLGEATSEDDRLEMLTFPDQRTDIISTQNKRKGLNGEGIIYAGMYKDDTLQEGHGTRFQTLTDTIYYENYEPGREYTIKAWLMDTVTKAPALDANNNEIWNMQTTQKQVASETGGGSWDISFEFDATGCGDRKYVSFIEVFLGSELVASYKEFDDNTESFLIPKITTKLKDNATGMDISYAGETVSLTDTISYSKMMTGANYQVRTKVIDVETKKELVDVNGNTVKVPKREFVAEDESGTWDIPISFAALIKNSDGTIKNSLAGKNIVVYEYVYIEKEHNGTNQWVLIADHEDFEDESQRACLPYIDTLALDEKTRNHISNAGTDMRIHDTVNYKKLNPKYKYKLVSELRDKSTGEVVVDDTNTEQVIETPVTIDTVDGTIKPEKDGVIFDLSAKSFAGRTLVVFERLYVLDGGQEFLVADHEILLDKDQTIHVPKAWTKAMIKDPFGNAAADRARVIDTFSYENLIPGLTYRLKGKIIDKNLTIQAGTDIIADGASRNELTFVPESSSGTVRLSFDVPKWNSGVFVVYEELYVIANYDGTDHEILVAKHTDINDLNQTIYPNPVITTSLSDAGTKEKALDAKEDTTLTDTITYKNFDPRLSYTIRGQLINMETGHVLTDSKDRRVEAEKDVIPDSTGTGQWEMEYRFDASKLSGTSIVAFEEVYEHSENGTRLVASHKDFWDKEQRAYIPVIDTVALNPKTNGHIADAEGNMIITDRVYYSHLELDAEYRLVSKLVDKETKETVVDDKGILQEMETTFQTTENTSQEKYAMELQNPFDSTDDPKKAYAYGYVIPEDGNRLPDGTEHKGVVFQLDAHTFEGRTLVVFEELQKRTKDGYITVARHMDIDDADQTIHVPKIRTHAFDSETGTNISKMDGAITIHDYVTYENLLPGQTYVLKATLMDKPDSDTKTESQIKDANGDYITGTLEFVPDSPNGTAGPVILQGNADHFMTDEGEFSSETLVVYEELYLKDSRDASDDLLAVADHKDINDENQTIYHPTIRTKAVAYNLGEEPKDGDRNHVIGFAAYKCDYCGTKFYTSQEAEAHLRQSQICQRKDSYSIVSDAAIYDTVYYENLMPNKTYEIVGHLIDVRTGKAVKVNQKQVQSDKKSFTPGSPNGETQVVFHVNNLELAGGRYVVYEELFLDGISIASHKEEWDRDQTFYVPDVHTSAKDTATNSHMANVDTDAEIIDTVELTGLEDNQEYYLRSALVETTMGSGNYGNAFADASGKTVQPTGWRKKGESVWHAMDEKFSIQNASSTENYSGTLTLEVRFVVDLRTTNTGISFKDRKFVVFQELFLPNGTLVGQHKDLLDEQQTIYTGGIHTTAVSSSTRSHLMEAADGQWMVDTIFYSGLDSGSSYYVTTNVYVKEDSDPASGVMKNVEPVNQGSLTQAKFIASRTGAGAWNVNIALPDLSKYAGKTLVVYEEIRKGATDGETVAYENNLYNEAQSVHIVGMSTLEKDNVNNKDGVHYTNAAYQWACNGCSEVFDAQEDAGKHTAPVYKCDNCGLEFRNKADAENHIHGECKKATVLRDTQLVRKENGNVIAEDWYQCSGCSKRFGTNQECLDHINGSDVCYSYANTNKGCHSYDAVKSKITDTVTYKNLIPGRKYKVEGRIYNVNIGEFVQDGDSDYIVSRAFTTYTSTNSVDMEFELDAARLAGYKYAVYERLYDITPRYDSLTAGTLTEPVLIASHEDETDKNQAFFIPKVETSVMDDYTKTNVTRADTTTTLYDTVRFEGLNVGSSDRYVIEGTIMDAETMEPLVLSNGGHATASSGEFTVKRDASGSDLEKTLEFTFSTSYMEGKTLVVFEKLYLVVNASTKVLIGQHTEIMDEKQTTYIPMVRTYAYDYNTGEQVSGADGSVTIIDKVVCSNLVKGKRYRLVAFVNPETGKAGNK